MLVMMEHVLTESSDRCPSMSSTDDSVCHADALIEVDRHILLASPKSPGKCIKHCPQPTALQKCVHIGCQRTLHIICHM